MTCKFYSFINFSKKIIDDVNYTYPNLGKFDFSLNKFIYSIEYFESIVCFKINRKKCTLNIRKSNDGKKIDVEDYRHHSVEKKFNSLIKSKSYLLILLAKFLLKINKYFLQNKNQNKIKNYFN